MSAVPNRKVVAGALAGAATTILVWGVSLAGVSVPPEVAAAFATILGALVAYFVPERLAGLLVEDDSVLIDEPPVEPTDVAPDVATGPEDG